MPVEPIKMAPFCLCSQFRTTFHEFRCTVRTSFVCTAKGVIQSCDLCNLSLNLLGNLLGMHNLQLSFQIYHGLKLHKL